MMIMMFGILHTLIFLEYYIYIYIHTVIQPPSCGSVVFIKVYMWKHLLHLKEASSGHSGPVGHETSEKELLYRSPCRSILQNVDLLKPNFSSDLYCWEVPLEKVVENRWIFNQEKVV